MALVVAAIGGGGFLIKRGLDHADIQPRLSDCRVYSYGEFEALDDGSESYESQTSEGTKIFSHAIENRVWIENPSNHGIKVTNGTLKINSINKLEESSLQLILGITNNKFSVFVVNNTFSDLEGQYFEINPFEFDKYHLLTSEEMLALFHNESPTIYIDQLPSGSIFKLYEFTIEDSAKDILLEKNEYRSEVTAHNLLQIRHYTEKDSPMPNKYDPEYGNQTFCPFAIYYDNDKLDYGYYSQGNNYEQEKGSSTIPIVYIDTEEDKQSEFNINIDNYIPSNETGTLVQYIVPNSSCVINYSIDIELNGKKVSNYLSENMEAKIKVPVYSINSGFSERNEKAYKLLESENIKESFRDSSNAFIEAFKYDPKQWIKSNSN